MVDVALGDRFDRYATLIGFWPVAGILLDSHYHVFGGPETFWTWRHAIVYSGVMVLGVMFGYMMYRGWRDGGSFFDGLPAGYEMAVVAVAIISIGGIADMVWHTLFGVEQGILEVGSASHLLLGVGALLLSATPLRRAWYTGTGDRWRDQFPMLTSSAFLLTILSYLTWALHPLVATYFPTWSSFAGNSLALLTGTAGMFLYTITVITLFLHLANTFDIVTGGFAYILGLHAVLMTVPVELFLFIPAMLLTGVVAELLRIMLQPTADRILFTRLYAFAVPFCLALLYAATVFLYGGTWWNIHEISAFIVLPGIGGVLVSYALYPSRRPPARTVRRYGAQPPSAGAEAG